MRISDWSSDVCSSDLWNNLLNLQKPGNNMYQERLLKAIPVGAHTYSRGYDQYPTNAPQILGGGKGAYVFDPDGKRYLDYGMALRAVNIGYAEDEIDEAAIKQIRLGNNLTRPSMIELEAAELLVDLIDRSEEHMSELQSIMRFPYAVVCLTKI